MCVYLCEVIGSCDSSRRAAQALALALALAWPGSGLKCCKYSSRSPRRERLLNLLYNSVSILFPQSVAVLWLLCSFCAHSPVAAPRLPISHSSSIEFYYRKLYYYYVLHSLFGFVCAHIFTVILHTARVLFLCYCANSNIRTGIPSQL